MELEELKARVKAFDKKAGFDKTDFKKLVEMVKEEVKILESTPGKKDVVNHKLIDLLILIMQIGYRYDTDFDLELSNWFEKSQKYLKRA